SHPNKGETPPVYTWTAQISGGTPPFTCNWYRNGSYLGSGNPYSITLGYDGVYNPYTWTLSVNVTDASSPVKTASASKTITEYSADGGGGGGPIDPKAGAAGENTILPGEFSVRQNYPNPFNPETDITFSLPEQSSVRITILDMLGREVLLLEDAVLPAGNYNRRWTGINAAGSKVVSGVYLYKFTAKGASGKEFLDVKKMLMSK
ncbi:MAG: T9SS type A sorting domain-containing protein, partial [Ignavibacteriaceae bacterium]